FGFNGIEFSNTNQGYLLIGHTALNQIVKMPLNKAAAPTNVQLSPSIVSPDGLLLSKDSKQLIIVNNTAQFPGSKVMTFETSNGWDTGTGTGAVSTGVVYPTTVTSDGKTEYVIYSYINLLFGGVPRSAFSIEPLPFSGNHPF